MRPAPSAATTLTLVSPLPVHPHKEGKGLPSHVELGQPGINITLPTVSLCHVYYSHVQTPYRERGIEQCSATLAVYRLLPLLLPPGSLLLPFCVLGFCLTWVKACKTGALGAGAAAAMKWRVLWKTAEQHHSRNGTASRSGSLQPSGPSIRERALCSLSEKQNKAMRTSVLCAYFNIEGSVFVGATCRSKEGSEGAWREGHHKPAVLVLCCSLRNSPSWRPCSSWANRIFRSVNSQGGEFLRWQS